MSPDYKYFEEQVFFSTVRIERPETNTMGTGFLVQIPACVEGKKYVFLVSNKHVLSKLESKTIISFHISETSDVPILGQSLKINLNELKSGYFESESEDVDLAMINISELVDIAKKHTKKEVFYRALEISLFSDYSEDKLVPNKKITFVGYPNDRYDTKNFLPIMRSGNIASIPKIDYEGKPCVLIDAQVFPGSSGSPVFLEIGGKWKFIGVVFQAMVRNQKVQIVETAQQLVTQEMMGIGLIVKSTEVLKLINDAKSILDKINCPTKEN